MNGTKETSMIRLRQVQKSFGSVRAVRGLAFEIPCGQVVGILGPNGAGKTTTVRMIAAAIPPSEGSVEVAGMDTVASSLEVRRRVGYLPESAPLYREMRVRDFLGFRASLFGLRGRAKRRAVEQAAGQCQLASVMGRRCGQLSKGFRQRVGLASVLVHEPSLLILDEPTSGLDPAQIAETRSLIRGLAGERTMLIVSHILPEVERSCHRIMIFAGGRVIADGAPDRLMHELPGAGEYTIECRAAGTADPAMVFGAVEGVSAVEVMSLGDGWVRCAISSGASAGDLREALARAGMGADLLIREQRRNASTLEDLYLRLMSGGPAAEMRETPS